jgi:hypothetical protein
LGLTNDYNVELIPDQFSFELIISIWQDVQFVGDLSTTTLMAHYLGFKSQLLPGVKSDQTESMKTLCCKIGLLDILTTRG